MATKPPTSEVRTTLDSDTYEHFREAARWIPTTDTDFEADGSLTREALHRITFLAVDIACEAEDAEKLDTFPTAGMPLNDNLYGIAMQEATRLRMTGAAIGNSTTLTSTQKAVIVAAFSVAARQGQTIRTMAARLHSHRRADVTDNLPF